MHTVRDNPTIDGPRWVRAFEDKYGDSSSNSGSGDEKREADAASPLTKPEYWDDLLGSCQAVCDIPAAFFGPELAAAYPSAKVVVLSRDPEAWYASVLGSIHSNPSPWTGAKMLFSLAFDRETRSWARFGMAMRRLVFRYDHAAEKDKALAWYEAQYAEFRERIPDDEGDDGRKRRLEYKIGDGWGPLCEHLGLPVPTVEDPATGELVEAPFPRLNDRQAFLQQMADKKGEMASRALDNVFWAVGRTVVTGAVVYAGYLGWKTRLGGRI